MNGQLSGCKCRSYDEARKEVEAVCAATSNRGWLWRIVKAAVECYLDVRHSHGKQVLWQRRRGYIWV